MSDLQPERPWEQEQAERPRPKGQLTGKQAGALVLVVLAAIAIGAAIFGGSGDSEGSGSAEDACKDKVSAQITGASFEFHNVTTSQQPDGTWWVRGTAGTRQFVCFLTYRDGQYEGEPMLD